MMIVEQGRAEQPIDCSPQAALMVMKGYYDLFGLTIRQTGHDTTTHNTVSIRQTANRPPWVLKAH